MKKTMEEFLENMSAILAFLKENEEEFNSFLERSITPKREEVPEGEVARIINSEREEKEKKQKKFSPRLSEILMEEDDYEKVSQLLKELGVPVHIAGYRYLKEAIPLWKVLGSRSFVTKDIYPEVAIRCNAPSTESVERTSRHAIETAYRRGNPELWEEIFSYSIQNKKRNPTNAEFIATVAEFL